MRTSSVTLISASVIIDMLQIRLISITWMTWLVDVSYLSALHAHLQCQGQNVPGGLQEQKQQQVQTTSISSDR